MVVADDDADAHASKKAKIDDSTPGKALLDEVLKAIELTVNAGIDALVPLVFRYQSEYAFIKCSLCGGQSCGTKSARPNGG